MVPWGIWYASANRSGFKGAGRLIACPTQCEKKETKRMRINHRCGGGRSIRCLLSHYYCELVSCLQVYVPNRRLPATRPGSNATCNINAHMPPNCSRALTDLCLYRLVSHVWMCDCIHIIMILKVILTGTCTALASRGQYILERPSELWQGYRSGTHPFH